jgi:hypothetical protein
MSDQKSQSALFESSKPLDFVELGPTTMKVYAKSVRWRPMFEARLPLAPSGETLKKLLRGLIQFDSLALAAMTADLRRVHSARSIA